MKKISHVCGLIIFSLLLLGAHLGCRNVHRITVTGTVYIMPAFGGSVSAAEGAKITIATDSNGNGRIELRERATATADANGRYTLRAPVAEGVKSTVSFSMSGYATGFRTIQVNTAKNIADFNATLVQMDALTGWQAGKWRNQSGSVEIASAQISGGTVRHFNPATESERFPGSFSDDSGSLLVSGVFTAFELEDAAGKRLATTAAGEPARIRMRLPRDTWGAVIDTAAGTDRIDVPMYYFNEDTGEWVRGKTEAGADLSGWLERDNGTVIPEAQLASVRGGTFAGDIFAASDVTHFSYWNVDWPIESHAAITITLLDADGNPKPGATIYVQGSTYTGSSTPQTTDANGEVCVDVMRSENLEEDVDQNGKTADVQKVRISASADGKLYNFDEFEIPAAAAACPLNCLKLVLPATPDKEVQPVVCGMHGTASIEGTPAAGIQVFGFDDMLDPDIYFELCVNSGASCTVVSTTDETGAYSLTAAMALNLTMIGYVTQTFSDPEATLMYMSQRTVAGCPGAKPVNLDLELLYCTVNSPTITVSGSTITLSPNMAMTALMVPGKWTIVAEDEAGFTGPVNYGNKPIGATQVYPLYNAAAQPLVSGDMIMVVPLGGYVPFQGYQCYSNSMYTVP